jgi:transposase
MCLEWRMNFVSPAEEITHLKALPAESRAALTESEVSIRAERGPWIGLTRFLEDGRLELDTNPVENAIGPVALTRKNALFAGHEVGAENWALLASLVATCKLNRVDPVAWIAATLQAILDGHPQSRIEDLMPWRFPTQSSSTA